MTEPSYRALSPDDYERFAQIVAVSYNLVAAQALEQVRRDGALARGVYRDGRLASVGYLIRFGLLASGAELPTGGVGMVATPPEERRRGATAALLRGMCAELRAGGALLAMLGAFKESFYARYGWATFYETRALSAPPGLFAPFRRRQAGRWEPVGAEAIPELDAIYRGALRARFGPLARDADWWRERVLDAHSYLWRDDAGAARAYALFHFEKQPGGNALHTREVVALDPQARAQIFALFASFEDQASAVHFAAPADAPVQMLMPDPLECRMQPGYMLRVLDVDRALAALPYPGEAQGRLSLRVADDWMPHNDGVFELVVGAGRAECRRLPDDAATDIDVDVRQLAQIISRHLRPRTAAAFGLIEARSRPALALLDRLFSGPAPFCSDWF